MRVTLSLPDDLAQRFLTTVASGERSSTVARLLEDELDRRDHELAAACQAANNDQELAREVDEWQAFDDPVETETSE